MYIKEAPFILSIIKEGNTKKINRILKEMLALWLVKPSSLYLDKARALRHALFCPFASFLFIKEVKKKIVSRAFLSRLCKHTWIFKNTRQAQGSTSRRKRGLIFFSTSCREDILALLIFERTTTHFYYCYFFLENIFQSSTAFLSLETYTWLNPSSSMLMWALYRLLRYCHIGKLTEVVDGPLKRYCVIYHFRNY